MSLVSIAFILFLLFAAIWALMSAIMVLLLIRYEGLSVATWIAVGLYGIVSGAIFLVVGSHLAIVGIDTLLPFISTY
ncbi:MAG: hypothetical protein AAB416_02590 [Patescibacteria group bacterium]